MERETIAAIATGMGNAGIGIVRISGDDAISVADGIFRGAIALKDVESHRVVYGHIVDMETQAILDEVLVTVFRAPRSYTREDVVEISSHGGSFVMQQILSLVYRTGARAAEAGEFTKRAFLNGRIDLSQAESVMDIIASDNERMLRNSLRQLDGALSVRIKSLRENILHEVAYIEAALDDPEHYDLTEVQAGKSYAEMLLEKISDWRQEIRTLSATAKEGKILRDGIITVIVGRPNVGKSSILNVLAKEDRAIVTNVPGTTRDTIEEKIRLGDMVLAVTDTAGIRQTDDIVESIGVEKSIRKMKEADLILYVVDVSGSLTGEDEEIIKKLIPEKTIVLLNKVDLIQDSDWEQEKIGLPEKLKSHIISISAKNRQGFEKLTEEMRQMFFSGDVDKNVDIFVTNARHVRLLGCSDVSLSLVEKSINDAMPEDFWTADLLDAYASLGEIIGEAVEDDLVEKVFSEFCMGK